MLQPRAVLTFADDHPSNQNDISDFLAKATSFRKDRAKNLRKLVRPSDINPQNYSFPASCVLLPPNSHCRGNESSISTACICEGQQKEYCENSNFGLKEMEKDEINFSTLSVSKKIIHLQLLENLIDDWRIPLNIVNKSNPWLNAPLFTNKFSVLSSLRTDSSLRRLHIGKLSRRNLQSISQCYTISGGEFAC